MKGRLWHSRLEAPKSGPTRHKTNPQTEQDCRAEELIGLGAGERAPSFVLLLRERKKDNGHAAGDAPATSVPRPRPRRRCVRSPHRDRDADAALGHAIALSYAQGPGAWGANEIIMPDGARFSMLEADPMKLTYY